MTISVEHAVDELGIEAERRLSALETGMVDLRGASGQNGRVGSIERRQKSTNALLVSILLAVLALSGGAIKAALDFSAQLAAIGARLERVSE